MDRHVVFLGKLHRAGLQHVGPQAAELQHFVVADGVKLAGVGDDPRVGGENAVHVGVVLAHAGVEHRAQGDQRRVAPAPAERGGLALVVDALKTRHDDDRPVGELVQDLLLVDRLNPCLGERVVRPQVNLLAGVADSVIPQAVHRHCEEGDAHLLSAGQQLVQLPLGRVRRHLSAEVHQVIGGLAHRGDDDDHFVPVPPGGDGFLCAADNLLDRADTRAAELLDYQCHERSDCKREVASYERTPTSC